MYKRKKPKKYTGILVKPISVPPASGPGLLGSLVPDKEGLDKFWAEVSAERMRRLIALLRHYDLDPQSPHALGDLAFRLAEAHVPGFRFAAPKGRPKKKEGLDGALWMEVRLLQLKSRNPLTSSRACELVAKKRGEKAPTLRRRFTAANKFWSRLFENMPKQEQLRILESSFGEPPARGRIEQILLTH